MNAYPLDLLEILSIIIRTVSNEKRNIHKYSFPCIGSLLQTKIFIMMSKKEDKYLQRAHQSLQMLHAKFSQMYKMIVLSRMKRFPASMSAKTGEIFVLRKKLMILNMEKGKGKSGRKPAKIRLK